MSETGMETVDEKEQNEVDFSSDSFKSILEEMIAESKGLFESGEILSTKEKLEKVEENIDEADRNQLKAIDEIKKLENEIEKKEERDYDVEKVKSILEKTKEPLTEMKYNRVFDLIDKGWEALKRSLFLPFPLLEKDVTLKSVIKNKDGRVELTYEIINRMEKPLGKLLINFSTPEGFEELPERELGMIGPKKKKSIRSVLKTEENLREEKEEENQEDDETEEDDELEEDKLVDLILENKVILTSTLDCSYKHPVYKIQLENVSDEPLRDITVKPFIPESLKPDKEKKSIEWLKPFSKASLTFQLHPESFELDRKQEEEESSIPESEVKDEVKEEEQFLRAGSNYLLEGEELGHSYSIFSQYFSKREEGLIISTTVPYKIESEFGLEISRDDLIWLTNIDSGVFNILSPSEIHTKLLPEMRDFVENNDKGVVFIDKLERMKVENGFEKTLEFLKNAWEVMSPSEFTLLVHVNPDAFSDSELEKLKENLRLFEVA